MLYNDASLAAPAIAVQIERANHILVLTHINPDGDAIGSMLGVWHALQPLGKSVVPLASSPLPGYTQWLPGIEEVRVYQQGMAFPDVDLVIMVDTASLARVGRIYDEHPLALASVPTLIIDHHVTNDGAGNINLIQPAAASTCELLYLLFQALNTPMSAELATCLLLGIITDTQSFQTSSTRAESLRISADLLDLGADQARIVKEVYYTLPVSSATLIGVALAEMHKEGAIAWARVTQAMLRLYNAEDEAVDEVVRAMQRVEGVKALVVFKERPGGSTKISLRSVQPFNVAALATRWGGGGHEQAAGANLMMTPDQAEQEVLPLLRALVETTN